MKELPLSKFAPFEKSEALFQWDAQNKLKDLNINCSNCIYFEQEITKPDKFNRCSILSCTDNMIKDTSFCKFFTNKEEINEVEEIEEIETKEIPIKPNQEMSTELQKLDFSSSTIKDSIKKLRENFINE